MKKETTEKTVFYPEDYGAVSDEDFKAMSIEESKSQPREPKDDSDNKNNQR